MGLAQNAFEWLQLQMYAPHGVCLTWSAPLMWSYIISDSIIALSYFSIPFALFYFIRKRQDIGFSSVFILFGLFILACGATHVMDVWKLWKPNYWTDVFVREFTAVISLGTAIFLWRLMPKALAIPSPMQLREKNEALVFENRERKQAENRFKRLLEATPDAMVVASDLGEIEMVNAQTEQLFGYPRAQLVGRHIGVLIPELKLQVDDRPESSEKVDKDRGLFGKHKDGYEFEVEVSRSPLETADGQLVLSAIRDVSERKEAERKLVESQALFQNAFDHAPIGIGLVKPDGSWFDTNNALQNILGYSKEELHTMTFKDITHPDDLDSGLIFVKEMLERKRDSFWMEKRYLNKDGEVVWVLLSVSAVCSVNDEVDYFIAQIQDITQQKRTYAKVHESEARFRSSFDNAGAGMALVDKEGTYLEVNSALCKMLGYSEDELLGSTFQSITHPEDVDNEATQLEPMAQKDVQSFQREKRFLRKDGSYLWTLINVSNVYDQEGNVSYFVNQIQDISEQKRAAADLEAYADKLERSNRDLQDFAYVASHDLQEPLRMVSSYVQLLSKRYGDQLDEDAKDFIAYAVDGAKRMQKLINDLLEYSRVNTRGKTLTRISSQHALDTAMKNLAFAVEEKGAQISHDTLPEVTADDGQLSLVFQNLIANALKFQAEDTPKIHVGAERCSKRGKPQWLFSVKDNGIGMKAESLERIFTLFQRLHAREQYEGTGIGLAICRRIIERHGGKIWVESSLGEGSTFYFTLPC